MTVRPSFNRMQLATSGQRTHAKALAQCMALDVLELEDPAAGTAAELKAATATVAAPVTLTEADLLAAGLTKLSAHGARAITFTTAGATASDAPANVVITGQDIDGNEITETLVLAQTAASVTSTKCYKGGTFTLAYPAADGTGATIAIGISDKFGLPSEAKLRGAAIHVLSELEDGAVPTAGAFVVPATSAPYGAYTPNSTPNGALDFVVTYEQVAKAF